MGACNSKKPSKHTGAKPKADGKDDNAQNQSETPMQKPLEFAKDHSGFGAAIGADSSHQQELPVEEMVEAAFKGE